MKKETYQKAGSLLREIDVINHYIESWKKQELDVGHETYTGNFLAIPAGGLDKKLIEEIRDRAVTNLKAELDQKTKELERL